MDRIRSISFYNECREKLLELVRHKNLPKTVIANKLGLDVQEVTYIIYRLLSEQKIDFIFKDNIFYFTINE